MNELRWTPGEWAANFEEMTGDGDSISIEVDGSPVACVLGTDWFSCLADEEIPSALVGVKANAHVLSAATDLYRVLDNLRKRDKGSANPYGHDCQWCSACCTRASEEADAALAKARGEA